MLFVNGWIHAFGALLLRIQNPLGYCRPAKLTLHHTKSQNPVPRESHLKRSGKLQAYLWVDVVINDAAGL